MRKCILCVWKEIVKALGYINISKIVVKTIITAKSLIK